MKKRNFLITISLTIIMALGWSSVDAQFRMRRPSFSWADDSHYYQQQKDKNGEDVWMIVDVATGKAKKAKEDPPGFTRPDLSVRVSEGEIYLNNSKDDSKRQMTANPGIERNPTFSPGMERIAFTRDHDLFVIDVETGLERRLTMDGDSLIYNGYASWVYFEEILGRGSRYAAFWWSPDGNKLAFLRFDDHPVPLFTLMRADSLHGAPEFTRYPKPGDPNPIVKLGIADVESGEIAWADFDETVDQYIAWPFWKPNSEELLIQVLNRDQNHMEFFMVNPDDGSVRKIYNEERKTWIDFFSDLSVLEDGSGYIMRSAKSDWMNLYYHDWNGNQKARLTDLDFRVKGISRLDEENGIVYFTATGENSTESHLFKVKFDGSGLVQLTEGAGSHSTILSPDGSYLIDTWSSVSQPTITELRDKNGDLVRIIDKTEFEYNPSEHTKTELVRIPTPDGFNLPATITYPLNFDPNKKYPVIFSIYGGPDAGGIRNTFSSRPNWYAQNDIIEFSIAHRASGHFGKKGTDYMWRNLGKWEILDYAEGVKWLRNKAYVDPDRMGITGGSYGGYTTAMALTSGADYWTHGIANYSVTSWRLYDNVYTERFMDTPEQNPEGYAAGSVMTHADKLVGKLRIVHGEMDDNVHMQNSLQLVSKLQDQGKDFELMIYPNGRHGWGGAKGTHNKNQQNKFWLKHFFGKE